MLQSIRDAGLYANRRLAYGQLRFYVALGLLGLVVIGFAATAVYALVLGGEENRGAVAAGATGAVSMAAIGVGAVWVYSKRQRAAIPTRRDDDLHLSMRRWFLFFLFAATIAIAFGVWEIMNGRIAAGIGFIVIAVLDVLVVVGVYAYKVRRQNGNPPDVLRPK